MFHACVERFDVMSGRDNILGWDGEVNKTEVGCAPGRAQQEEPRRAITGPGPLVLAAFFFK
jgi:hypothetical protein